MSPPASPVARPPWPVTAAFLAFVGLLVVAPLVALVLHGLRPGPAAFAAALQRPTAVHALLLTLRLGLLTTLINGVAGLGVAWALVRWDFPGRGLLERLVELPLAVPTLVAGVLIVALYGPQGVFGPALEGLGLQIVYARPALLLALLFITFPFGVRAVEPALRELDPAEEQAAWTLGATRARSSPRASPPPWAPRTPAPPAPPWPWPASRPSSASSPPPAPAPTGPSPPSRPPPRRPPWTSAPPSRPSPSPSRTPASPAPPPPCSPTPTPAAPMRRGPTTPPPSTPRTASATPAGRPATSPAPARPRPAPSRAAPASSAPPTPRSLGPASTCCSP